MKNVILKTDRTEMKFPLDFITPKDIVCAIGDIETVQYMDSVPSLIYNEEDALRFLNFLDFTKDSEKYLQLGIFDYENKKFVGMCTLEAINRNTNTCELGYWLCKNYVGKGYMYECASELVKYAKEILNMKKIYAFVICEHKKSISLLSRLGFKKVATLLDDTENKGQLANRYKFELDYTN